MTTIHAIADSLDAKNIDYSQSELLAHVRLNYKAYCPKCGSILDYANISDDEYLGACLDCDEDFYSIECYLERT